MIHGYTLTCPRCAHKAPAAAFEPSCADECTCPKCGEDFIVEYDDEEEEE